MKLYNTLTRRVEEFVSNEEGMVRMYTCGPTVYHYAHIGNLRSYITEDILQLVTGSIIFVIVVMINFKELRPVFAKFETIILKKG